MLAGGFAGAAGTGVAQRGGQRGVDPLTTPSDPAGGAPVETAAPVTAAPAQTGLPTKVATDRGVNAPTVAPINTPATPLATPSTNTQNTQAYGQAPQQYNLGAPVASTDPNVFTTPSYIKALNAQGTMGSTNVSNNNQYANYQNDMDNWQKNNAQRQGLGLPPLPMPQAPTYQNYNSQGFDQYWNALTNNGTGFNSTVTPDQYGLANSVQNGVTNGNGYSGPDPTISSNPSVASQQTSNWTGPGNQGGNAQTTQSTMNNVSQQMHNPNIGYSGGGQQGLSAPSGQAPSIYNSWGMPGAGNPFQYMTGQSSTPQAAIGSLAQNSGVNSLQGIAQLLNALGINIGGGQGGGVQPWGGQAAGYGGMGQNNLSQLYGGGVLY